MRNQQAILCVPLPCSAAPAENINIWIYHLAFFVFNIRFQDVSCHKSRGHWHYLNCPLCMCVCACERARACMCVVIVLAVIGFPVFAPVQLFHSANGGQALCRIYRGCLSVLRKDSLLVLRSDTL